MRSQVLVMVVLPIAIYMVVLHGYEAKVFCKKIQLSSNDPSINGIYSAKNSSQFDDGPQIKYYFNNGTQTIIYHKTHGWTLFTNDFKPNLSEPRPIVKFTNCGGDSLTSEHMCKNDGWKYYAPGKNPVDDTTITLSCIDPAPDDGNVVLIVIIVLVLLFVAIVISCAVYYFCRKMKRLPAYNDNEGEWYDLSRGTKLAIIFNNEHFEKQGLKQRIGTDKDCKAIKCTFEKLGFVIQQHDDLTSKQIRDVVKKIGANQDLSCLALFILTHGGPNLYAYDGYLSLRRDFIDNLTPIKCKQLTGKPKLIFVQADRGDEVDSGAWVNDLVNGTLPTMNSFSTLECDELSVGIIARKQNTLSPSYRIPNYADILVFQSCYDEHVSFESISGSWFIQKLCEVIDESGVYEDLVSILTRASNQISQIVSNRKDPKFNGKMQMPQKQDTLTKKIYLKTDHP